MRVLFYTFICVCYVESTVKTKYLIPVDNINDYDPIEEIQHAACRIATKEIQATANATITRQLRGVCTSRELNNKLERLERTLLNAFEYLQMILEKNGYVIPTPPFQTPHVLEQQMNLITNTVHDEQNVVPKLGKRSAEIMKLNTTLKDVGYQKEFYYYWVLEVQHLAEHDEVLSGNFYCSGRIYYIKLSPHHLGTKYITLELKSAGPIRRTHRFIILDPNDSKYDISSQVLSVRYNHADMYRISGDKLKKFVNHGNLIIKLILYI